MWRRRQQIAWRMAQADTIRQVIYIEQPLTLVSLVKYVLSRTDSEAKTRWKRVFNNRALVFQPSEKIKVITPITFLPFTNYKIIFELEMFLRYHIQVYLIRRIMKRFNPAHVILWTSLPYIPSKLIENLKPRLLWYDCTEDFSLFPKFPETMKQLIRRNDEYLTKSANVVSVVSKELYERKKMFNASTYWIPNAVDINLFQAEMQSEPPADLASIPRVRLTFVGMVNERLDWKMLSCVAGQHPEWSIVLIGPISLSTDLQQNLPVSIFLIGQKQYEDLSAYLYYSDLCINIYKQDTVNNTGNSQKILLYLASGKPIVATRTADVENYSKVVRIAETSDEFVNHVQDLLSNDNSENKKKGLELAQENSWDVRVSGMLDIISERLEHTQSVGLK